ncbi:MAG: bifunctional methylenetetrahydrofolate dehydrogenase/methenyltetrahydrofolate cyclohydrolase FolD [Spirochaetaceae bacterium]|jgi:methylenetetrahydrofolate dehydrogenase (NADP+)/methenyltetrahydrofolate cyclohydrolase|nr:bifunctional methylenetetrahydrofolate dehydrogenase/methenyltetrahydrofolate cyclohydrolase FolD [Spirochaetaceae bacterium]
MAAELIDGKLLAQEMKAELKEQVSKLKEKGITPGLGVILVGNNPASNSYVKSKEKACESIGIFSDDVRLPENVSEKELLNYVERMNKDDKIHGILVQLPLPKHINENKIINAINPDKDVDGFHPVSVGKMVLGQETFLPCTPHGVLKLLERYNVETEGAEVLVIGRSNIVGKPVANLLMRKDKPGNSTVTVCHTRTKDILAHSKTADIIIVASGYPDTLTADMVKEDVVVIDVGINRVEDSSRERGYRLIGDADFESLKDKVRKITPVPGGVGPMTITMLLFNTVKSAQNTIK